MPFDILTPPKMIIGPAALTRMGEAVAEIGRRALIVTGRKAMRRAGVTEQVGNRLIAAGVQVTLFEDVPPEPPCETCDAIRDAIRSDKCDVVLGLGGGSALDAAKVAAGLAEEEPPVIEFWQEKSSVTRRGIPFVAVPTLSGSGAEVTRNGVLTNPDIPAKKSIRHDSFVARLVVVDPYLTLSTPPDLTAQAGLDALVQAMESFTSRGANPLTDAWAVEAVLRLKDSVLQATRVGGDLLARTDVAYGSLLAGLALSNARLGLVHGMAHPIGARFKVPHGLVCAVLMPHVARFNRESVPDKFARLDAAFGGDAVERFEKLMDDLGVPRDLKSFGIKPQDVPVIIEETLPSGSTKSNPRTVTPEICAEILRAVI
jgi:alcohol dehydrogenase class IV